MTKESQIEKELIDKLGNLKYIYRPDIRDNESLLKNFREKFESLNRVELTNSEFNRLVTEIIDSDVFDSSKKLRQRNTFQREDGTPLQYTLVNINEWCKNVFEVVNQLRMNTDSSHHRYDVILLMNGIPVVQIELKSLQVTPRRAMQQIVDYKSDLGNGYSNSLLCFIQLFIVSNRTDTFYFANNNKKHFSFKADEQFLPVYRLASEDNKKITHLNDFAHKFLSKCTLAEMISRYMVLVETEQKILVMRPYQIYAVKAIVDSIRENRGNGYIWHTTGSGKTLTSFKASTLLKNNPDIEKCFFVVDRKDLDRQTREEFNKFQENCVEENTNTEKLVERMLSADYANKVIVTTIQKLGLALDPRNEKKYIDKLQELKNKRVVFIFDECHRSQFGENHKAIKDFFPKAQLFGFTGTPIFEENSSYKTIDGQEASYKTTKDVFENELPAYTITHAIEDKNVLRFHIDYFKPEEKLTIGDEKHKQAVVNAIIKKHNSATDSRRFNAVFATASINDAIAYYNLFKTVQADKLLKDADYTPLNIACVFSPPAEGNKEILQIQEDLQQEKADYLTGAAEKKKALTQIIKDYNKQYSTNFIINKFDKYYEDIQKRIKDQQYSNADYPHRKKIDITIVVDMMLTGFDSKYLNTLYVDKNLKHHGLIQAFSRTNRVLNDTKPYGNILDFRLQENSVNQAITLFSGEKANKAKEIWLVEAAPEIMEKYEKAIENLNDFMQEQGLQCLPEEVHNLKGEQAKGAFVTKFREVQKFKNELDQYTDLSDEQNEEIEQLMSQDALRSFKSVYLDTAKQLKALQEKRGEEVSAELQELDIDFVLFSSAIIDYDYIMGLIANYTQNKPSKEKMTRTQLISLLSSSANLLDEREDMADYINTLEVGDSLTEQQIREGYQAFKDEKFEKDIKAIAKKHEIELYRLKKLIKYTMRRMIFDPDHLMDVLAPLDLGWKSRMKKELALMEDLVPLLNKLAQGQEIAGLAAYE